jgi:hypothetical protein
MTSLIKSKVCLLTNSRSVHCPFDSLNSLGGQSAYTFMSIALDNFGLRTLLRGGDPKGVGVEEEEKDHAEGHEIHVDQEEDAAVIEAPASLHAANGVGGAGGGGEGG